MLSLSPDPFVDRFGVYAATRFVLLQHAGMLLDGKRDSAAAPLCLISLAMVAHQRAA